MHHPPRHPLHQPWVRLLLLGSMTVAAILAPPAMAELVLFDGQVRHGELWADRDTTTVALAAEPASPANASDVIEIAYDRAWRSGGLSFFGVNKLTLPPGHTRLRLALHSGTHDAGLSEIRLSLDDQLISFGNGSTRWTADGEPGTMDRLTRGTWHQIELDLASDPAFTPGDGRVKGYLALVAGRAGDDALVVHLADVRFLTPDDHSEDAPAPTAAPTAPPAAAPHTGPTPAQPSPRAAAPGETITLTIHPEPRQQITQWGIVTHNRPDWGKGWDITRYPASLQALYDELGATVVRFHIDYRTYDNPQAREDLKNGILAVTSRGLDWYGLPWSPPVAFKTLDTPNGRLNGEINRLKGGYEDEVAAWLVELVQWLESEGVPLPVGIGPQNEPDWPPPSYPGCIYTAQQIRTASIELRKALDAAGYPGVKVVADDGGAAVAQGFKADPDKGTVNLLGLHQGEAFHTDEALRDSVGILATHTYDIHNGVYQRYPGWMQDFAVALQGIDKELWMSEWETRHEHTFSDWQVITENINHFNRDMSSLPFNGWIAWQTWKSWLLPEGPPEEGEMVGRIRANDTLIYKGVNVGDRPGHLDLRVGSDSNNLTLELRVGSPDAEPLVAEPLAQTPGGTFVTHRVTLPSASALAGPQDLYLTFASDEHWREAWLDWFAFADGPRVEAEAFTDTKTTEKWSSKPAPSYVVDPRLVWVHDDGQTLQKRPVYYLFKKIWTNAPAGQGTVVRRVTSSDDDTLQGESKAPRVESHRQDLSAFQHGNTTTFVALNRRDHDQPVRIEGLTGPAARVFRYDAADASTVNVDLHDLGTVPVDAGRINSLTLPARSLTILVTEVH